MKKFLAVIFCVITVIPLFACSKEEKVNFYDIDIVYKDNKLDCSMDFNYVNHLDKTVFELYFSLYPNAFKKDSPIKPLWEEYYVTAYPNGESYGELTINSVKCKGENLKYSLLEYDNILKVELLTPVKSGEEVLINFNFLVTIPNCKHRFGYCDNTVNITNFYPVLCEEYEGEIYKAVYSPSGDPFYSSVSNYKVSITAPSTYIVASSLSPTSTEVMGATTKYNYFRKNVRDIAFILSEKFNITTCKVDGTQIYYYYFSDKEPQKSLNTIVEAFKFFSNKLIKYPYGEYVVCEADFIYGGMEYPCLTFIDGNLQGENRDYTLAHETAHEWWYGLVGVNECEEGFIDEGLTEISTVLFMSEYFGLDKNAQIEKVKERYKEIRMQTIVYSEEKRAVMKRGLSSFYSDLDYLSIAYYRSQIMFDDLLQNMGEKKFYSFLKGLLNNYKYKNITYNDLKEFAEKKHKGSKNLLDGWVYGQTFV